MTSIAASLPSYPVPPAHTTTPTPPVAANPPTNQAVQPVQTSAPNPSPGPINTNDRQGARADTSDDNGPTVATSTTGSENAPALYTALASASSSNIRGTQVNTSA